MATLDIHAQPKKLSAETLRKRCIGGHDLILTGEYIVGRLDLTGAHLEHALRFVDCQFQDGIDLSDARADEPIEWLGGTVATVVGDHLESKAHIAFSEVTAVGVISLRWAHIQGDLRFSNSTLRVPQGLALDGRDLRVDGSLFLAGPAFLAEGEVCLSAAHIKQSLDCRRGAFRNPSGPSLNAYDVTVDGEVLLEEDFTADGEVCLERATVGRLRAGGGTFRRGNGDFASHADALCAKSGVFLDHGFQAFGGVRLVGADITGELCCTGARFGNPAGIALDARRLQAEDVYLDHEFRANGAVRLDGSFLSRQLNCSKGEFFNEQGYALDCDDMQCDGDVFLDRGFSAKGEVRLMGAQIKNGLTCTGGRFENQGGTALNADGFTTPGNAFLDSHSDEQFHSIGVVRLARATVGRQLVLSGAVLTTNANTPALDLSGLVCHGDVLASNKFQSSGEVRLLGTDITRDLNFADAALLGNPVALNARGLRVGGSLTWQVSRPLEGTVDLSHATVGHLDDSLAEWPKQNFVLADFTCQTPPTDRVQDVTQLITWLGNTKEHYSDAYQQFGAAYRMKGNDEAARDIAIARQRDLRKRGHLKKSARIWNRILDVSSGYGYKLYRPLLVLLGLALLGWIVFYFADAAGLMEGRNTANPVPFFMPLVYSVQLLIPLVDLDETSTWLPNTSTLAGQLLMTYVWIMILLGWVFSGALVAGIGRLWRQGDR